MKRLNIEFIGADRANFCEELYSNPEILTAIEEFRDFPLEKINIDGAYREYRAWRVENGDDPNEPDYTSVVDFARELKASQAAAGDAIDQYYDEISEKFLEIIEKRPDGQTLAERFQRVYFDGQMFADKIFGRIDDIAHGLCVSRHKFGHDQCVFELPDGSGIGTTENAWSPVKWDDKTDSWRSTWRGEFEKNGWVFSRGVKNE